MAENNYKVEVVASSKELTKREKIKYKDYATANSIDGQDENFKISVGGYVKLHVTNDNSDTGEYDVLLVLDREGNAYRTSSKSFTESFMDIYNEMTADGDDEVFEIGVKELPSKNYANKTYKKCVLI